MYLSVFLSIIIMCVFMYVCIYLTANDIIDKNIRDLKIRFGTDNGPIGNHRLPNMYWTLKRHENFIRTKFITVDAKTSMKPLAENITSIFVCFLDKYKLLMKNLGFLKVLTLFW